MVLRIATLVVVVTSAFFLHRAAAPILEQNRRVREWPAVDVNVTARFAETRAGGAPQLQVEYRHEAGGTVYRRINNEPRSEEWTPAGPKLITERQSSYTRRGYYDPARPRDLIFAKTLGFGDYWPLFFWGPLLGLGVGGLALRKPGRSATVVLEPAGEKGWYRLRPKYSIRRRAAGAWVAALVCGGVTGFAAFDYFTGEPRARTGTTVALVCVGVMPALVALIVAGYYTWLAARVADASVAIDSPHVMPGSRVAVRVELTVKTGLHLERVDVSLACVRSAIEGPRFRFAERVIWEQREERDVGRRAQAGGRVVFEQRFLLPPDAQPSSAAGTFGPWIDWEIRLAFHLDGGPDYRGKFQVPVEM